MTPFVTAAVLLVSVVGLGYYWCWKSGINKRAVEDIQREMNDAKTAQAILRDEAVVTVNPGWRSDSVPEK